MLFVATFSVGKIFIIALLLTSFSVSVNSEPKVTQGYIPLWIADPAFYEVVTTQIFPLPDLTNNDLLSFSRAMVAWNVRFQNQIIPMYTIIEDGKFSDITALDSYLTVYWQNFGSEVLVVGTSFNNTTIKWISPDHVALTTEIPNVTANHSASFNPEIGGWDIFFQNSTGSYLLVWDGFSSTMVSVNYTVIDSWQIFKLIRDHSDNSTYIYVGENKISIPLNSSNLKMFSLGILEDFPYLDLAVYDFTDNGYFKVSDNQIHQFPFSGRASIHRNIFPSTYFVNDSGAVFTFDGESWINILELSETPSAIGSVNPTLSIVTVLSSGVWFQFLGSDFDGDFLPDEIELAFESSPISSDTDGDGLSDLFEYAYSLNPNNDDSNQDLDGDGLTNLEEMQLGLDPTREDSDWGGAIDGWEVSNGFDPKNRLDDLEDSDDDGLPNYLENLAGTDPWESDTDLDGIPDSWEYFNTLDPLDPNDANKDYDFDGLTNMEEYLRNSHPYVPDNPFPIKRYLITLSFTIIPMFLFSYYLIKKNRLLYL